VKQSRALTFVEFTLKPSAVFGRIDDSRSSASISPLIRQRLYSQLALRRNVERSHISAFVDHRRRNAELRACVAFAILSA
jgi:hypothetical protein